MRNKTYNVLTGYSTKADEYKLNLGFILFEVFMRGILSVLLALLIIGYFYYKQNQHSKIPGAVDEALSNLSPKAMKNHAEKALENVEEKTQERLDKLADDLKDQ